MTMSVAPATTDVAGRGLDRSARQRARRPDGPGHHEDVVTRMIGKMARNMEAMSTTGTAPQASDSVRAGSVVGAVAADRVKRLFGRGGDEGDAT